MRWLVHEWDHREPRDKLHDIDCGHYLSALQELPDSLRQLLQEGDMHVELRQIDNDYRVVKIIKKREPEFLQGSERYFVFDNEGHRIPLSEEEFDQLVGMQHNPEDVFESENIELETIDSEHVAPMDIWDISFDAGEYMTQSQMFIDAWNEGRVTQQEVGDPHQYLEMMADAMIYSADWFPYPADKRLHSDRAREIAHAIKTRDLTRSQLGAMIGPSEPDSRIRAAKSMQAKARGLRKGREKGQLLVTAQKLLIQVAEEWRGSRTQKFATPLSATDKNKLWSMWREQTMARTGEVKLMPWQFERWYRLKLQREIQPELALVNQLEENGVMTEEEAETKRESVKQMAQQKLQKRMEAIYKQKPEQKQQIGDGFDPQTAGISREDIPWLNAVEEPINMEDLDAPLPEECMVDYEDDYVPSDWLPSASQLDYPVVDDEGWLNAVLLDGGPEEVIE